MNIDVLQFWSTRRLLCSTFCAAVGEACSAKQSSHDDMGEKVWFAQVGSFVAHAGWVTALAWCAVGDYLVLATGCSEGSVRLYTAAQAALADLPDILPAPTPEDQAPTATEPQTGEDARGASEQTSSAATVQTIAATAGGSNGAADGARLPAMQLMAVLMTADLRGVTCIDLRLRSDSSTGENP